MSVLHSEPSTKARRLRHLLLVTLGQGEIGARVKQAREEAGLTQQELAERAGLKNGANVSRVETGRTQLTPKRMRKIAEATRKPLEFFVRDLDARQDGAATEGQSLEVREALVDLTRAVAALASEQRRQADEIGELRQALGQPPRRAVGNGER
jgi:transcriptional regulator with XRE-family HTH domain